MHYSIVAVIRQSISISIHPHPVRLVSKITMACQLPTCPTYTLYTYNKKYDIDYNACRGHWLSYILASYSYSLSMIYIIDCVTIHYRNTSNVHMCNSNPSPLPPVHSNKKICTLHILPPPNSRLRMLL